MLSPRYLDGLTDEISETYSQLENDILCDMAKRIARLGKITDATKWQAQMLAEAGGLKKNIARILKRYDKKIIDQVTRAFTDALETSAKNDNRIFKDATGRTVSSGNAQQFLSTIQKCHSDLQRLTLTTAYTTETQFVRQANRSYMMTQSGAFDYDTAMEAAALDLAKEGITTVAYKNTKPVNLSIETAVRMNILTSINQTCANQTLNNADILGVERFEVTAHKGARPEHEAWQGKIFTRDKLYSECGLGSVTGLCGINCRHSFYPYIEGTENQYTQDDLDELAGQKVTFTDKDGNKKELTRYEGEQYLRHIEHNIRHYKRLAVTQEAFGRDNTKARKKIGEWQARARDFTEQTNIARDRAREWIATKDGTQPRGISTAAKEKKIKAISSAAIKTVDNNNINDSIELAKKMFPNEKFIEQEPNIFVSEYRIPKNKQQKAVFEKEMKMAQIAKKSGHYICLLSERGSGKNPDSIMDGEITELKNVTGNVKAVGKRFSEAMKQGKNVFLNVESDLTIHDVYKKIKGEINANNYKTGKIFIFCSGKMYVWNVKKLL